MELMSVSGITSATLELNNVLLFMVFYHAGKMGVMCRDTLLGLFSTTGSGLQGILLDLACTLLITRINSRDTQRNQLPGSRTCWSLHKLLLSPPNKLWKKEWWRLIVDVLFISKLYCSFIFNCDFILVVQYKGIVHASMPLQCDSPCMDSHTFYSFS